MQRFEITTPTQVLCKKFQTRSEHHGEALVTAADLRVIWETKASALLMLHPELCGSLLSPVPDGHSAQGELALAAEGLNFLRFKHLEYPLKWDREYTGWMLHVDYGIGEEGGSGFKVPLCKLHKFEFTPKDNEMCEIEWTISSSADIDEEFAGHMSLQQQQKITISLLGPNKTEEDAPIDASSGSGAPGTNGAAPAADDAGRNPDPATQMFIEQHGPDAGAAKPH